MTRHAPTVEGSTAARTLAELAKSHLSGFSSHVRRVLETIAAGSVALVIRFSSPKQYRENKGSLEFQQRQMRHLEPYGVSPEEIELFISVESAHGVDERPDFERLLRRIATGEIRLVVAAFADRLSRNWPHFQRLADALERVKGIIMLDSVIYDLATDKGLHDYRDAANDAVYQSALRIQRNLVHMCSKARRLALPYNLPVGYCWASLEDAVYMRAIETQQMRDALGDAPKGHLTNVVQDGRHYLILPYPDREVYDSMILRRDVLLQTRDLRAVIDLMHSESQWPRRHHLPVRAKGHRFSPSTPIEWRDLRTYKSMTQRDKLRGLISRWYASPSLYGIYQWQLADDVEIDDTLRRFGAKVRVPNANPDSLFRPEQRAIVREILGKRDHKQWEVNVDLTSPETLVPKALSNLRRMGLEPVLPEVRCSTIWQGDTCCHAKLTPFAVEEWSSWRYWYHPADCGLRHPLPAMLTKEAEDLIVQAVFAELSPDAFRDAVARIELKESVEQGRLVAIRRELKTLDDHLTYLRRELERAQGRRERSLARQLLKGLAEAGTRFDALDRNRADTEVGLETERALEASDRSRIYRLASRLPELWEKAAAVPGARAAIMGALIRRVHVRRIAARTEYVEIEFPSGVRITRILCLSPAITQRSWQEWCLERLRPQLQGERLHRVSAEDLAEADRVGVALTKQFARPRTEKPWRGIDVRAAAILALCDVTDDALTEPIGETVAELAARAGCDVEDVNAHARRGRFGAPTGRGGEPRYRPSEAQLCKRLLPYARRQVAIATGWPEEDLASRAEITKTFGIAKDTLWHYCQPAGLMAADACGRSWLRRSSIEALLPPRLDEAVAALKLPGVSASDFVPALQGTQILKRLSRRPMDDQWHCWARTKGYALVVDARTDGRLARHDAWMYLPSVIREATDHATVLRWMRGQEVGLTAWTPEPPRTANSSRIEAKRNSPRTSSH
ncbi:MAG: recombinase family protein [Proteobacteria bacterium]|nr:recombinase family protein [Pseudomonadota bacterium]